MRVQFVVPDGVAVVEDFCLKLEVVVADVEAAFVVASTDVVADAVAVETEDEGAVAVADAVAVETEDEGADAVADAVAVETEDEGGAVADAVGIGDGCSHTVVLAFHNVQCLALQVKSHLLACPP